jgi:hypothetical protein
VATVFGIPYAEAHARLAKLGRKPRAGFRFRYREVQNLGLELRPEFSCQHLKTVLPEMASGRFIVRVAGHVFAVVDGVVVDLTPPINQIVLMVYSPVL